MRLDERPPRERRWLTAIHRQVDRMAHLVEDLLIVVRLHEHQPELHTKRFDADPGLVREPRRGSTFRVTLPLAGDGPVSADTECA